MGFELADLADLVDEHEGGDYGGHEVGDGEGRPDAVEAVDGRQNEEQRHHEDHLARQRQEDGFAGHPQGLEEVGADYLEAYHPEGEGGDLKAVLGAEDLGGILHEHLGDRNGVGGADDASDGGHADGADGGKTERGKKSVIETGTVVVS